MAVDPQVLMLMFTEVLEDVLEDDVNINANATRINAVVSTFMRRNLKRTKGFCNLVVPALSIDEFKNHFSRVSSQKFLLDIFC